MRDTSESMLGTTSEYAGHYIRVCWALHQSMLGITLEYAGHDIRVCVSGTGSTDGIIVVILMIILVYRPKFKKFSRSK